MVWARKTYAVKYEHYRFQREYFKREFRCSNFCTCAHIKNMIDDDLYTYAARNGACSPVLYITSHYIDSACVCVRYLIFEYSTCVRTMEDTKTSHWCASHSICHFYLRNNLTDTQSIYILYSCTSNVYIQYSIYILNWMRKKIVREMTDASNAIHDK